MATGSASNRWSSRGRAVAGLAVGLALVAALSTGCSDDAGGDIDAPAAIDAPADAATYRAIALFTALDRILILRTDPAADQCGIVRLVSPAGAPGFGITTPANWDVEMAGVTQGAVACETDVAPAVASPGGTGQVTFTIPTGQVYPTALSIDATLRFDTGSAPAWVPATLTFRAVDLTVE